MICTTYGYNVFQSVASFMPVSVHATRSMLLVFILWFFPWAEMQFVQAGPLADAVEKAKVAAGVTREIPVPELDVQEKVFDLLCRQPQGVNLLSESKFQQPVSRCVYRLPVAVTPLSEQLFSDSWIVCRAHQADVVS